jgi:hypothetical protein
MEQISVRAWQLAHGGTSFHITWYMEQISIRAWQLAHGGTSFHITFVDKKKLEAQFLDCCNVIWLSLIQLNEQIFKKMRTLFLETVLLVSMFQKIGHTPFSSIRKSTVFGSHGVHIEKNRTSIRGNQQKSRRARGL